MSSLTLTLPLPLTAYLISTGASTLLWQERGPHVRRARYSEQFTRKPKAPQEHKVWTAPKSIRASLTLTVDLSRKTSSVQLFFDVFFVIALDQLVQLRDGGRGIDVGSIKKLKVLGYADDLAMLEYTASGSYDATPDPLCRQGRDRR